MQCNNIYDSDVKVNFAEISNPNVEFSIWHYYNNSQTNLLGFLNYFLKYFKYQYRVGVGKIGNLNSKKSRFF